MVGRGPEEQMYRDRVALRELGGNILFYFILFLIGFFPTIWFLDHLLKAVVQHYAR